MVVVDDGSYRLKWPPLAKVNTWDTLMTLMCVSAAGWHLEQVVVVDEGSGKRWSFSCDRWDIDMVQYSAAATVRGCTVYLSSHAIPQQRICLRLLPCACTN
jgi:hypothetical protein